ncbi:MAG: hypothetical protein M3295_01555, partial [Chloroflexota bacterium]|nr:hypothetical protein [Chloroflexota bacterium]
MSVAEPRAPAVPGDDAGTQRTDASGRGSAFRSPEPDAAASVVQPLIFEASRPGRRAVRFPSASDAAASAAARQPDIPAAARRSVEARLPQV